MSTKGMVKGPGLRFKSWHRAMVTFFNKGADSYFECSHDMKSGLGLWQSSLLDKGFGPGLWHGSSRGRT